jgi:hypothetical protein
MHRRRIYVYKCVVDNGGAPCVDDGVLTLAICKPSIRSTARERDLIFAFGSNNEQPPNRLVYIAVVSKKLERGQYFLGEEFQKRGDCIYEARNGNFRLRRDARFHGDDDARRSDLGSPPDYSKANTLLAKDFRYFGRKGKSEWKSSAPVLKSLVEGLRRGHRVNYSPKLETELAELKKSTWRANPRKKVLGKPLHSSNKEIISHCEEAVKIGKGRCYYEDCRCDSKTHN